MAQPCCCMHPSLGQACDCTSWLRENAHSHPHLGLIHVLGCEPRGVEHGLAGALALRLRDFRAVLVQSKRHLNSWAGGALLQNLRDAGDDPAWPPTPSPLQRPAQSRPTGRSGELHRAMSEAQRGGGPTLIIRPRPGSHAWLTEIPPPPRLSDSSCLLISAGCGRRGLGLACGWTAYRPSRPRAAHPQQLQKIVWGGAGAGVGESAVAGRRWRAAGWRWWPTRPPPARSRCR